jgi:hypothetical protein
VIIFSQNLLDNIFTLHFDLLSKKYKHGPYCAFKINDPKPRDIHNYCRILRTSTKRRIRRKIKNNLSKETLSSYLGLLKHGNTKKLKKQIFSNEKILSQDLT